MRTRLSRSIHAEAEPTAGVVTSTPAGRSSRDCRERALFSGLFVDAFLFFRVLLEEHGEAGRQRGDDRLLQGLLHGRRHAISFGAGYPLSVVPVASGFSSASIAACGRRPSTICARLFGDRARIQPSTFGIIPPSITPEAMRRHASLSVRLRIGPSLDPSDTPGTSVRKTSASASSATAICAAAVSAFTFRNLPRPSTARGA